MKDPIRDIMNRFFLILIFVSWMGTNVKAITALPDGQAVQWRDTLYVRITDSVFVESDRALEFSVEIYRPNDDWNRDEVLGDFDLYFTYSNKAFSTASSPSFVSLLDKIDQATPRKNLLYGYTQFYAGLYGISGRADNPTGEKFTILPRVWTKLCRVSIPMSQIDQNPGIRWDEVATGAMTAGGNPIILKLSGDVVNNPKATVKAAGLHVMPELQCQGEDVYVYVREAITSGRGLSFTWRDSIVGETWNTLGSFEATSAVKTGSSKDGRYQFEILGDGDTLLIKNSPGVVDGMFFNCTLTDASVGASMTVDTVVNLRDSLYGYLASTTPSVTHGMTSQVDTVKKCPGSPARLDLYAFGPTWAELRAKELGNNFKLYYCYLDEDLNTQRDSIDILLTKWIRVTGSNALGKDLFKFSWETEHSGKMWVESIKNDFCNNGVGYPLYDTLFIEEVGGDLNYNLNPLTVSVNECIDLDTATTTPKSYTIHLKNDAIALGYIQGGENDLEKYSYCADGVAGVDTIFYEYSVGETCKVKAFRNIEVVENSYLTMKVLLEGLYLGVDDKGQDTMKCVYLGQERLGYDAFPRNNIGRLHSPYEDDFVLGVEIRNILDVKTKSSICDWVYIRLKEEVIINGASFPANEAIDSVSAFVLQDGTLCDVKGEVLKFKNINGKKVYIEIKHRNHLRVRSQNAIVLPVLKPNGIILDFTDPTVVYFGTEMLKLVLGKYCLYAGDLNDDNYITVPDKTFIMNDMGKTQYDYDVNGDNYITVPDKNVIHNNLGVYAK